MTPAGGRACRRVELDGLFLTSVDLAEVMARIERACLAGEPLQVMTINLNLLTLARRKPFFRSVINGADMALVDGRILLWLLRGAGEAVPEQITGHDLMRECLALGQRRGLRMFLLGGAPGVAERLAARLEAENPGLRVMGTDGGRFTETGEGSEDAELIPRIRAFAPHLLFLALGQPKQDAWIARNLLAVGGPVAMGVGGVFDTLSGTLPRAPRWMQRAGLESPYQLVIDPKRYWRRYLLDDPPTLARLLGQVLRRRLSRPRP